MKRRDFLQYCGTIATRAALPAALVKSLHVENARGDSIGLESLQQALDPADGLVLTPDNADFEKYQASFNKRKILIPRGRVLCNNANAVATALAWAKQNRVPLALRSGGHSYEGFSQSLGLVIDTRTMSDVILASDNSTFETGAGAHLGDVYNAIAVHGVVIPAGSCPSVGVTGHVTGGGYGLIARGFGLASDSLIALEMVLADGKIVTASADQYPDLFWAMRGAGGGSFGIVTRLHFKTHRLNKVYTFSMGWTGTPAELAPVMQAWQQWAPEAPNGINSLFKVMKRSNGQVHVSCFGQSIGTNEVLMNELSHLTQVRRCDGDNLAIHAMPFLGAVKHFGGSETNEPSVIMKAKSDYLKRVMKIEEAEAFLSGIPSPVTAVFDSYGGAIRDLKDTDTAFAHREGTISSVQYYLEWKDPRQTPANLQLIRGFYNSARSMFSGFAYANYPDLELPDYAQAYWGANLDRLIEIKNVYDAENLFRHAQSVPLKKR